MTNQTNGGAFGGLECYGWAGMGRWREGRRHGGLPYGAAMAGVAVATYGRLSNARLLLARGMRRRCALARSIKHARHRNAGSLAARQHCCALPPRLALLPAASAVNMAPCRAPSFCRLALLQHHLLARCRPPHANASAPLLLPHRLQPHQRLPCHCPLAAAPLPVCTCSLSAETPNRRGIAPTYVMA